MSQDPNNIGLLPPPPLLPTQPLPLPVSQYSAPTHYPPPLPPPPLQPVYGNMQYPATNMQSSVPGYLNPYQQNVQGISTQAHYNAPPAAAALNPVNQAQAIYAAASQMMIGNMMMDQYHLSSTKRRKKRSGSPKRRLRSRSESPPRNKRARDSKRRRNRSPNHKRSYTRGSISPLKPQKREEKKSEETKKEEEKKEEKIEEEIYQPPTPEENVVAVETEPENDQPDGNKTPDYQGDDGTPKTPEYDATTGSAITPPISIPQSTGVTSSSRDTTTANHSDNVSLSTKSVASVKPTVSPKMISLKKIRDDPDISSPAPDVGVKSLAEILREAALKSMKKRPTPERESERESERNTRDVTPESDHLRTRAESPTLDRSTTESAKLARPFDDIDRNMFKPEASFDSDDDFYSDDEFDPKKYERNSEDELLASPERKNDLTGITMNFTVTPKMSKDEKRKAKLEKKRAKELKKKKKEDKKLKKLAKKINQASESTESSQNNTGSSLWQRKMISSQLSDNVSKNISPKSTPPTTPENEDAEFLKTPEKCDEFFFEAVPTPTTEEPKPKKKAKRKVVIINKDLASTTTQPEISDPKPEVKPTSPFGAQPTSAVFGATIRSLVPNKAEQINTVSTTANRQVKGFNPFAPASSQPATSQPTPSLPAPSQPSQPIPTTTAPPPAANSVRSLNNPISRQTPLESKQVKRMGGVKTIKIKKTAPAAVSETKVKPATKPAVKTSPDPIEEDLDLDKELDLLNAALDGEPATFKSTSKVDSLDDDDDLFADLEEFLNEERRNL